MNTSYQIPGIALDKGSCPSQYALFFPVFVNQPTVFAVTSSSSRIESIPPSFYRNLEPGVGLPVRPGKGIEPGSASLHREEVE